MRYILLLLGLSFIYACNNNSQPRNSTNNSPQHSNGDTSIKIVFYRNKLDTSDTIPRMTEISHKIGGSDEDAITLGVGVNSKTGKVKRKCLAFKDDMVKREQPTIQGKTSYYFKVIESAEDLTRSMGLDMKASLGWGFFSGEGVSKFFEETNYNNYSLYLMVNIVTQMPSERIDHILLDNSALQAAHRLSYTNWLSLYGNEVVTGINKGGQLTFLFTLNTNTAKEYSSTYNSLKADIGGLFFSASAETEYREKINKLRSYKYSECAIFRSGNDSANIPQNTLDGLIQYSLQFPSLVYRHPSVHSYIRQDIRNAENFPKQYEGQKYPFIQYDRKVDSIAENLVQANQALGNIKFYKNNNRSFVNKDIKADNIVDRLKSYKKRMDQIYNACTSSITDCDETVGDYPTDLKFNERLSDGDIELPQPANAGVNIDPMKRTFIGHVQFGKTSKIELRGALNTINVGRPDQVFNCVDVKAIVSNNIPGIYNTHIIIIDSKTKTPLYDYIFNDRRTGDFIPIENTDVDIYVEVEGIKWGGFGGGTPQKVTDIAGTCTNNPLKAYLY